MKLKGITLIAALSFTATSGLMAKPQAKDEVPGVAAQPVSYFYTGKPYDADLGAYTFQYRNYDPELKRWTSSDPSGFPDGPNNMLYVGNTPGFFYDTNGLKKTWYEFFEYNMKSLGMDSPSAIFTSAGVALGTANQIEKVVAFGSTVTVSELIGAGILTEKLAFAGGLYASIYAGALTGASIDATYQYLTQPEE